MGQYLTLQQILKKPPRIDFDVKKIFDAKVYFTNGAVKTYKDLTFFESSNIEIHFGNAVHEYVIIRNIILGFELIDQ